MEIQLEKDGKSYIKCVDCDYELIIPKHCGRPMKIMGNNFVCWKGEHNPCCNSASIQELPFHHEGPMKLAE